MFPLKSLQFPKTRSKIRPVLPTKPQSVIGFWSECQSPRSTPVLPRKPCSAGKVYWLMLGSAPNLPRKSWFVPGLWTNAQLHTGFAETPCSLLVPTQNTEVEFAENTLLCEISVARTRAKPCYASALHAGIGQPKKPCSVLGFSA